MSPIPLEMYSSATSTDPPSPSKTAKSPIPPTEAASAIMLRPVWTKEDDSRSFSVPLFSVPFSTPVLFLALSNTVRTRFLTPNLDSFRSLLCRTALDHVVSTLKVLRLWRCGVFLWTLMEGLVRDDCCRASMVPMRESLTVDTNNNGGWWCDADDDPPPPTLRAP